VLLSNLSLLCLDFPCFTGPMSLSAGWGCLCCPAYGPLLYELRTRCSAHSSMLLVVGSKLQYNFCFHSRGSYSDSKLKGPVKPCAGNVGTQITVTSFRMFRMFLTYCSKIQRVLPSRD
jgi:hypothetical protein